jgi:hypothetical protein
LAGAVVENVTNAVAATIREAIVIDAPVAPLTDAGGTAVAVMGIVFGLFTFGMLLWGGIRAWWITVGEPQQRRRRRHKDSAKQL